jgi:hypothetical protein
MRAIFTAVIFAAGLGILGASGASAAPANGAALATANADNSQVQSVMGGCGRGRRN